jgi:hypothetical protein
VYKKRTDEELKKMASFCRMREVTGEVQPLGPTDFALIADGFEELIRARGIEPATLATEAAPIVVRGNWPFPKKGEADASDKHD